MSTTNSWLFSCLLSVTLQLFRLSIDTIQTASKKTEKDYEEDHHNATNEEDKKEETAQETSALLPSSGGQTAAESDGPNPLFQLIPTSHKAAVWSMRVQVLLLALVLLDIFAKLGSVIPTETSWAAFVVVGLGILLTVRDVPRQRLGYISRFCYVVAVFVLWLPVCLRYYSQRGDTKTGDELILNVLGLYLLLALSESIFLDLPQPPATPDGKHKKKTLSRGAMVTLLKPYFWPDETADSAMINRLRAILTWVCVILSRVCNLSAPMFLGWATTALAHGQYRTCIIDSIIYATVQFLGSTFSEGQNLIYLKVAQAAFVQLSETTFMHLHQLSLDWHLRKKLGEVIRSMDRGIAACDTLMKYLFLWLIPALAECVIVCIIFATYFQYPPLAVSVFYFVWLYIVWTIVVTLWRKKFRKAVVKSDNEWHDRCTDSLLNFETVKYFTAEDYERRRFGESVQRYQSGSVQVQASLSFLNVSQKNIDAGMCPGMQVGDFVAVLSYIMQLFTPLNYLGSLYNAIVMAIIDLTNLSELLAEDPDVVDAPDAIPLPSTNADDPDIAVEFDNVVFHYPTQPTNKGLKGLSFKMKKGTTTAIVGSTGAGKTTVSRLLFRFYDVLGGAVKVNGKDVRIVQQKSLRQAIGAVAQSASLFSDTVKANLRYGRRDATDEELIQAAKDAQLLGFIESLDDGWDTMVGDRGLKLSGGERQRASIARCLLKDPPFVLLDEATSALDTLTENSVQEALDRLGSERTVLVIAHRLGTIRNADNIIVLKDGVVAEQGTHDELLDKNGIYADMWNLQLHSNTGSQVSLAALNDTADS